MHTLDGSRPKPAIEATRSQIAPDCYFGEDVRIEAEEVEIGPGCKIGFSGDDDFRTFGGVRIKVRRLVLGAGVTIGRAVKIEGGEIVLDEGVKIQRHSTIKVLDTLHIGAYGTVGENGEISGRDVQIGQELWMLPHVKIGGGSAFENESRLVAGHYLHLGIHSFINTARPVQIGNEVGMGTRTQIYTHGAYPSRLQGFPVAFDSVEIGDYAWIPGATINPGVRIGANCVIGVNSLVTRSIPDGCLAGGSPAKVIKENCFPSPLEDGAQLDFFEQFFNDYARLLGSSNSPARVPDRDAVVFEDGQTVYVAAPHLTVSALDAVPSHARVIAIGPLDAGHPTFGQWTVFDTARKRIDGIADKQSARLLNELRRYGVRFYSRDRGGMYVDW